MGGFKTDSPDLNTVSPRNISPESHSLLQDNRNGKFRGLNIAF